MLVRTASTPLAACAAAIPLALAVAAVVAACSPAIDAQLDEAQSLVAEGRPMAALPLLQNVVQRRPEDGPANLLLGQVLLQVGQTRSAFAPLERALAAERWAVPAGLLLASAHLGEGHPQEALQAANRILATHPDQTAALRVRATAQLQIGEAEAALADARRILELDPADSQAPVLAGTALTRLGRLDEAEATLVSLELEARESGARHRHASACSALAAFLDSVRREADRAEALWRSCLEAHPADPSVLQGAIAFFGQRGDTASSIAALEGALEAQPSALGVRLSLAHHLAGAGRASEGDQLLLAHAEQLDTAGGAPSPEATAAFQALASYRQRQADPEGALHALERAIARAPEPQANGLRFQQANLLIELRRLEEAQAVREQVETPALASLLGGRLALVQARPAEALEAFERSAQQDPSQARTFHWMGIAAQSLGQIEHAQRAFERALEIDPAATDAALAAGQLHAMLGEHEAAIERLRGQRRSRGTFTRQAVLLEASSLSAVGRSAAAAALLDDLLRQGMDPDALAMRAELLGQSDGPAAGLARIEAARAEGLEVADPRALSVLQVQAKLAIAAGRPETALATLRDVQKARPDWIDPITLEAGVLAATGDTAGAGARLRAAVEANPEDPGGRIRLAGWLFGTGALAEAEDEVNRARERAPANPDATYLLGQIATRKGDPAAAERALRATLAANPLHAGACNDLAWLLAEEGRDLDQAEQLARRALRLDPSHTTLDTLGFVQLARNEPAEAVQTLREAASRAPEVPGYRYRLGLALARSGREAEARTAFEEALRAGPFPEAPQAREELARLEP